MKARGLKRVQDSPLLICAAVSVVIILLSDLFYLHFLSPAYGVSVSFGFSPQGDLSEINYLFTHGDFKYFPEFLSVVLTLLATLIYEATIFITPILLFVALLVDKKELGSALVVVSLIVPFVNLALTVLVWDSTPRYVMASAIPYICVLAVAVPCVFAKSDSRTVAVILLGVLCLAAVVQFVACLPPFGSGAGEKYYGRSLHKLLGYVALCLYLMLAVASWKTPSGNSDWSRRLDSALFPLLPSSDIDTRSSVAGQTRDSGIQQGDALRQLRDLKELLDLGVITQEDFETKKRELLKL